MKKSKLIANILVPILVMVLTLCFTSITLAAVSTVNIEPENTVVEIQAAIQGAIDGADEGDTVTVTGGKDDVDEGLVLGIPEGVTVELEAEYFENEAGNTVDIGQDDTVAEIQAAIQGAIDSADEGDTVTVTGGKDDVDEGLVLDIPEGVTVEWKADYSGDTIVMINLRGSGILDVVGGKIENSGTGWVIFREIYSSVTVVVSGGIVKSTGMRSFAISNMNIEVSGGTVEAIGDGGIAIDAIASTSTVTVTGGTVEATNGTAIRGSTVYISGGTVSATSGTAIDANNITVEGGTVSTTGGFTIQAYKSVAIKGGTVSCTTGTAIFDDGINSTIIISNGTVKAEGPGAPAIYVAGIDTTVTVEGGTVLATGESGHAIFGYSTSPIITVSGGMVESTGSGGVSIFAVSDINVTGGTVAATTGDAICTSGFVTLTGGNISSTTGTAIVAEGVYINDGSMVTVSSSPGATAIKTNNGGSVTVDGADATLTVNGNIEVAGGFDTETACVYAINGGVATVNGNIKISGHEGIGVLATDGGKINVKGNINTEGNPSCCAVAADGGEIVIVGNLSSVSDMSSGAIAADGGKITITGDINVVGDSRIESSISAGVISTGGEIIVNGKITTNGVESIGACALEDGKITINGKITTSGEESSGAFAAGGGNIGITGDIIMSGLMSVGVQVIDDANVTVKGNISATGRQSFGMFANNGAATITGNISTQGVDCFGIYSMDTGMITVNGHINIAGDDCIGVFTRGGDAKVTGNISASGNGAYVVLANNDTVYRQSNVIIDGNISATNTNSTGVYCNGENLAGATVKVSGNVSVNGMDGIGILCVAKGQVTVDGIITADIYIGIDGSAYTMGSFTNTTTKPGYLTYTNSISTVWVKAKTITYDLTIIGGTGSGSYPGGAQVSIKANAAPEGQVFDKWTGGNGGVFANINSATTTFTMPSNNTTITATYKNAGSPVPVGGGGGGAASNDAKASPTKADYDVAKGGNISITLTLNGKTLTGLKNGSYALKEGTDYTVSGNNVSVTEKYLLSLPAGTYNIAFEMSGGVNPQIAVTITGVATIEEQPTPLAYLPMAPTHSAGTRVEAIKTNNALVLNGEVTEFPAVKVSGYNWLKLRDFAMLLKGTPKQFAISYDTATGIIDISVGQDYQPVGEELADTLAELENAVVSLQQIRVNGEFIDVAAYNIKGYNYFRLRDLAIILNFAVIYDEESGQITLDFENPYKE